MLKNILAVSIFLFITAEAYADHGRNWLIAFKKPIIIDNALSNIKLNNNILKNFGLNPANNLLTLITKNGFEIAHRFENFQQVIVIKPRVFKKALEKKAALNFINMLRQNHNLLGIDFIEEDLYFPLVDENTMVLPTKNMLSAKMLMSVKSDVSSPRPKLQNLALTESSNLRLPWGINAIAAFSAWQITQGAGSRVMVLDSGIDANHPALIGNIEQSKNFMEGVAAPYDYFDEVGHGTHVAGTIAGHIQNDSQFGDIILGVAPEAKLLIGRVCAVNDGCSVLSIIKGLDWAISEGVDVVNLSLGSPSDSEILHAAIQNAVTTAKIVVVAASGNDGTNQLLFPAQFSETISVGAIDNEFKRAEFSQYGPSLNIVAPGVGVLSSIPVSMYGGKNGTSMAAPHVTGAVALLKSVDKSLSPEQIKNLLADSAKPISPNPDNQYGQGILNIEAALNMLLQKQQGQQTQ